MFVKLQATSKLFPVLSVNYRPLIGGSVGWPAEWNRSQTEHHRHHDGVIKWKHFPRYWPFVRGIHRSPVNSPHKGQRRGALMFSLICVWINDWVKTRKAGDLRRYRAHHDVTVMTPDVTLSQYHLTGHAVIFGMHEYSQTLNSMMPHHQLYTGCSWCGCLSSKIAITVCIALCACISPGTPETVFNQPDVSEISQSTNTVSISGFNYRQLVKMNFVYRHMYIYKSTYHMCIFPDNWICHLLIYIRHYITLFLRCNA